MTKPRPRPHDPCTFGRCLNEVVAAGRCAKHSVVNTRNTYASIHVALYNTRGAAKSFSCHDCGEPAKHWSYAHGCLDEKTDRRTGFAFCPHTEHYFPRCRDCHHKYDLPTHCLHGHELTPENLYVDPSGARHCRTCRRSADRKRPSGSVRQRRARGPGAAP